ncbi:MAG: hypothetical protein ACP5IX_01060 [Patescibacteria group bacterium]
MTPFYIGNSIKGQQKHAKRNQILNIGFLTLIILSVCAYLIEANFVSVYSFKIEALKERIKELESNNQLMEMKLSQLGSTSNLDLVVRKLNFVKVTQADYFNLPITTMAAK